MRIVAGAAKGTRLGAVPPGTRPLSDRAREGLFSSLGRAVLDAEVLDLFAGTGAIGIEALSRGASRATFVERSPIAVAAIHDNLERTHLAGAARVVLAEAGRFLRAGAEGGGSDAVPGRSPDLVFIDPPYDLPPGELERVLELLDARWLRHREDPVGGRTGPDGWKVCLTRPVRSSTLVVPIGWVVARRLEYGDNLVICYHREG
jgi:16S rRNA (guanine(966)-N(2))-methyltransferase RsmD